ncbi:MAG: hypothetical protein QGI45_13985 [Myxococcota bacterium]|nr:hypothetical protein [Myxococcota bacterium]
MMKKSAENAEKIVAGKCQGLGDGTDPEKPGKDPAVENCPVHGAKARMISQVVNGASCCCGGTKQQAPQAF